MPEATPEVKLESSTQKQPEQDQVFDREYVLNLRRENAKYRSQRNALRDQAAEYEKMVQQKKEEEGKFKELYESAKSQLDGLTKYKDRVEQLETSFNAELEGIKTNLTPEQNALLDDLPAEMAIEKRIKLAKELSGKNKTMVSAHAPDLRGGGDSSVSAESTIKRFAEAGTQERMEILFSLEKTNPTLYNTLIHS